MHGNDGGNGQISRQRLDDAAGSLAGYYEEPSRHDGKGGSSKAIVLGQLQALQRSQRDKAIGDTVRHRRGQRRKRDRVLGRRISRRRRRRALSQRRVPRKSAASKVRVWARTATRVRLLRLLSSVQHGLDRVRRVQHAAATRRGRRTMSELRQHRVSMRRNGEVSTAERGGQGSSTDRARAARQQS